MNADRSAAAAGLFCFAAGMMGMMWSLGLTQRDIKLICSAGVGAAQAAARTPVGAASTWAPLPAGGADCSPDVRAEGHERSGPDPALMRDPPVIRATPAPLEIEPVVEAPDHDPVVPEIVPERRFEPMPDPAPQSGRGIAFDHSTDRLTRTIAERFAPAGTEAARETAAARHEPELPLPDESAAPADFAPPPAAHVSVPRGGEAGCRRPPLSILKRPAAGKAGAQPTAAELRNQARQLESVLSDFGVRGEVKGIHPGPVVTLFELEPARGTKSARVIALADDIARSMSAASVRAAVVPAATPSASSCPTRGARR